MTLLALSAALLMQQQPAAPPRDTVPRPRTDTIYIGGRPPQAAPQPLPPAADTSTSIFDTPGTRSLVERVIRAGSSVPAGLNDYRARAFSTVSLSLRADSAQGAELPVTVDEFASEVRWDRSGGLEQEVRGQRVRMLAPTPYTVGSMLEAPWIIPTLYGTSISVFSLAPTPGRGARVSAAVHPFSWRGLDLYHYSAGDTVRVRTQQGVTSLVPITVRPRASATDTARSVAGTFYVDVDRAAVARARFGFVERSGRLLVTESGVYFELENALVAGQYWLPYRQRREIQIASPLLGGAAAIRIYTVFTEVQPNTGWRSPDASARLTRHTVRGDSVFAGFARAVGDDAQTLDIADFADLRAAVRPPNATGGPIRASIGYERGDHLFRYNRVEGTYLGLGVKIAPRDPDARDWDAYGTAGYAMAEGTVRGELSARYHPRPTFTGGPTWGITGTGYRRLREMQSFRPPLQWDLGYSLGAALAGYDVRDYYDAAGGELQLWRRRGPLLARIGGRFERHDSVSMNAHGTIFGGDPQDFPLLAPADPGTHAAVEGELRYTRGSGAFSIGNSLVAAVQGDAGFADFHTRRLTGLLSFRRSGKYLGVLGRGDAGMVDGAAPPQFLFRFGGIEGLRGYDRNEFGGSRAALGRGRVLVQVPPFGSEPLVRSGIFVLPPLRPAIVLSADAGWTSVSEASRPALLRLGARETDGVRWSYGAGLSIFQDAVSAEYVWPGDGGKGKWYVGFVSWF